MGLETVLPMETNLTNSDELLFNKPKIIRSPYKKRKYSNNKIVQIYEKNDFKVVATCKALKINPDTWYVWLNKYPDLKYQLQMARESVKDDIEKTLIDKAKAGDTQLLLYLAKTLLKDRGYGAEKGETSGNNNTQVNIVLPEDTSKKYEWWGGKPSIEVKEDE
jgi:hypothetical protein